MTSHTLFLIHIFSISYFYDFKVIKVKPTNENLAVCLKCQGMFPCHTKHSNLVNVSQEFLWT